MSQVKFGQSGVFHKETLLFCKSLLLSLCALSIYLIGRPLGSFYFESSKTESGESLDRLQSLRFIFVSLASESRDLPDWDFPDFPSQVNLGPCF